MIDRINLINDYKNGFNISKLEEKYGGARKTIRKVLFSENLIDSIEPKRKKYFEGKVNIEIRNKLLLRYKEEKNLIILSKELNIPCTSLYTLLRKEGVFIPKLYDWRKYPINEHFFDNIDSEEKAYFLGILYADGTNSLKKTEVSLRLAEDDIEVLKKLNNLIQPTKPIGFIPKQCDGYKNQNRLTINSKILSYKLNELGIMPNKTFKLEYPLWLDDNLHRHFIRGYFDGDGGITINEKKRQATIGFTGTENMMIGIRNILTEKLNFGTVKLYSRFPERNNNNRTLLYGGRGNTRKFGDFIYENATIFMKRKKDKFDKYLN